MEDTVPAAILFDMDGTLLDSEKLWERALQALATRHGRSLSTRALLDMTGRSAADSMRIFYRDLGLAAPDRTSDERFIGHQMRELFAAGVDWRPGAQRLLDEVSNAGLPRALVTSTHRRLVEVVMTSTLGHDTFDVVVCGNEVSSPKPHPESYLTAAHRLGVPVERCVAIEDSPIGIASASTAGAVVLAVPGEVPLAGLDGAHLVSSLVHVDLTFLSRLVSEGPHARVTAPPGGGETPA
jgi:HAD superfamily hydrolase (TIGR01509 family)